MRKSPPPSRPRTRARGRPRRSLADSTLARLGDLLDHPRVEVHWVDAASSRGWRSRDEARADDAVVACRTMGRLIRNDRQMLTLAQTVSEEGGVGGIWAIPAGWVRKIERLR